LPLPPDRWSRATLPASITLSRDLHLEDRASTATFERLDFEALLRPEQRFASSVLSLTRDRSPLRFSPAFLCPEVARETSG
jgi:hypothetical protein